MSLLLLLATVAAGPEALSEAVAKVRSAVVSINVARLEPSPAPGPPELVQVQSLGSGFVFDPHGYILTCNHVVANYERIDVRFVDGTEYRGSQVMVTGRDPVTDLAVIRVDAGRPLPAVRFADSDSLEVGQWVAAVGDPFGLAGSATAGVVSGLSRWGLAKSSGPDFQEFIQTDALINPGNSGGPLIDTRGRVVGVSSFAKSSGPDELSGIGFATPSNLAREVARQLVEHGRVIRGYLGASTQPITDGIRQALGLAGEGGALVAAVAVGSPAERAGIRAGDVVLELDGEPVPDVRWLQNRLAGHAPLDTVTLSVSRRGRTSRADAVLDAWPVAGTRPTRAPPARSWLGLLVRDLDDADRLRTGAGPGVVVRAVEPAGPADDAGVRAGDIIVEISLSPVENRKAFDAVAARLADRDRPVLLRLLRNRTAFYVAVGP